jgi:diguanylate cyclase (GGDEF)-like protein
MTEARPNTFGTVLRIAEFRALWIAEVFSVAGDQLARVALALLVFSRTGSASLTALTYALTFVPALIGGWLLSGLADRWPRRTVLVVTDLVRAGLAAAMAIPGLPLGVLWAAVAALTFASAPFKAAQQALLPDVLPDEGQYKRGLAVRVMSNQCAQLVGFGAGGALVVAVSPAGAMLINSATFIAAAFVVATKVRRRPAPALAARGAAIDRDAGAASDGLKLRAGQLVVPFALVSLIGLFIVPEGLAAPYAGVLGAGSVAVGLLMAADPAGSIIGAWLENRLPDSGRLSGVVVPAALAGLPLIACLAQPRMPVVAGLWAISGALTTIYLIRLQAVVVKQTPNHRRGLVMGRYTTCLYASQGLAILGGGVLAERTGPVIAVAVAGGLGTVLVGVVALAARQGRRRRRTGRNDDGAATDGVADDQVSLLVMATSSRAHERSPGELANPLDGSPAGHGSADSMTDSRRGTRRSRRIDRPGVRGWALWTRRPVAIALLLSAEALAAAVVVVNVMTRPVTQGELLLCGTLVVLGMAAAEITRNVERLRRRSTNPPHVNLSSVWTFSAALVLPVSLAAVVATALYAHMWLRSWRKLAEVRPHQVIYNCVNVILSIASVSLVAGLAHTQPLIAGLAPTTLAWLVAVLVTYFLVNSALAAASAAAYQKDAKDWSARALLGDWHENVLEISTLCMGAITALLLELRPWAVVLIFVPLFILHKSVLIKHLEDLATTDAKTGLLNSATWRTLADRELDRAGRYERTCGLLLLDLDHFREINSTYGHLAGDEALQMVGSTITSFTRGSDVAGRWGGDSDEFVVLLPDTSPADLLAAATRLRDQVAELTVGEGSDNGGRQLSVSIGAAAWPTHGASLNDVFLAADNALFAAKNSGRGRVYVVDGSTRPPTISQERAGARPPTAAPTPPPA